MSIVSGTVGAVLSSDAQNNATKTNAANVVNTNAQNYNMFLQSRGSNGNAVLPTYMKGPNGGSFEQRMGNNLSNAWMQQFQLPGTAMADYRNVMAPYQPMMDGARTAAAGIFDGDYTKQRLQNFAPVAAGNVSFSRQAAMDALNKSLANIEGSQAQQGFAGGGSGTNRLKFQAQQQAANTVAGARLSNLSTEQGIRDAGLNLQLANLSLPNQMAESALHTYTLPQTTYNNQLQAAEAPLNFLRLGVGQPFNYQQMPYVYPNASAGQLAAMGASQGGNALLNYYLKNQQASNANAAAGAAAGNAANGMPASASDGAYSYNPNGYIYNPGQAGAGAAGDSSYFNSSAADASAADAAAADAAL